MQLQKQPTWLKEVEMVILTLIVVGAPTWAAANHLIDPQVAGALFVGLGATLLVSFGHRLGLPVVPIANLENMASQMVAVVNQAQQLHAQLLQQQAHQGTPSAPTQPAKPATPVASPASQPGMEINLNKGV